MLIFEAKASTGSSIADICRQAVEYCNQSEVGMDLTVNGVTVRVVPGMHWYNVEQEIGRRTRSGS